MSNEKDKLKEINKNNEKKEKEPNNKEEQDEEELEEETEEELEKEEREQNEEKENDGKRKEKKKIMNANKEIYDKTIKNIELKNYNIYCFIGNEKNRTTSEEIYNELKLIPPKDILFDKKMKVKYIYGENQYIYYYYPLFYKKIKIYNFKGKQFKAVIYFMEDIKNIVKYFKMKNPHYFDKSTNEYKLLLSDNDYETFLLEKENEIIKDISYSPIKYKKLEKLYKKKEKVNRRNIVEYLKDINDNLYNYSKVNILKSEKVFYTQERKEFSKKLEIFFEKDKKILGIYGNYSSGKSISIMMNNYYSEYPSLYLNLKALNDSFQTKNFTKILPNEAMNIYIKSKKSFKDYKNFIKKIYENTYNSFLQFIFSIIKNFINWKAFIFLDQFSQDLFDTEFINELQKIINSENVTIKILLIITINDKISRNIYIDSTLNYLKGISKIDNIEFIFLNKLISKDDVPLEQIDKNLIPYLESIEYLPFYYSLMMKDKANIDEFFSKTKKKITDKINKFFEDNNKENNIIQMNDVRLKINEEIDKEFFIVNKDIIPFKYFYIEKENVDSNPKFYLKCHFPLIKEIWNEIVYSKTFNFFDGEINYNRSISCSLLELNFINQCQEKDKFSLGIDCVVELDELYSMDKITKSTTKDYKNKNILLLQKNEDARIFDVGFLNSKNNEEPSMAYIQIKKSLSDNNVDKSKIYNIFENNKTKFENFFNIKPKSCYLIYITLVNKYIKNNIDSFEQIKKTQKKYNMDNKVVDYIKRINALDEFCRKDDILLYYFNPNESKFYIRNGTNFFESKLNLFNNNSKVTKKISMKITLLSKKKEREFNENELKAEELNKNYNNKK